MDPIIAGALISGGVALTGAGISTGIGIGNKKRAERAYKDYRSDVDIHREREDNAIQRRVADLKAAGLNPLLAANAEGSGATQPSQGTPAEMADLDILSKAAGYEQIRTSQVQRRLIQEQINYERAKTEELEIENRHRENRLLTEQSIRARTDRIQDQLETVEIKFRNGELYGQTLDNQIREQHREMNIKRDKLLKENLSQEEINTFMKQMDQGMRHLLQTYEFDSKKEEYLSYYLKNQILQLAHDAGKYDLDWSILYNRRTNDRPNQGLDGLGRDIGTLLHDLFNRR